jgi:hypothetical protein
VLSLALPSAPTTDSWGWIVWGREVLGLDLRTDVGGAPSWKPLPVAVTALLALLGDVAPEAWLVVARAGGLAGFVLAYLVGSRLAGPVAGAVASLTLLLSAGWLRGLAHGYTEPIVASLLLGALLAHLAGRGRPAFALLVAASLARPELWPLLAVYGVWLWRREPQARAALAVALAAVPLLWVGIDWLASDRFLAGGKSAWSLSHDRSTFDVLELGIELVPVPALILAGVAVVAGLARSERLPVILGAGTLGWSVALAVAADLGYASSPRLLAPAVAALCVLAGMGAAALVDAPRPARLRYAVAAALVALSVPFVVDRASWLATQYEAAEGRAALERDLREAARRAHPRSPDGVVAALPRHLMWARGAIAWEWDVPLRRIGEIERPPRGRRLILFVPHARLAAAAPRLVSTRYWTVVPSETVGSRR